MNTFITPIVLLTFLLLVVVIGIICIINSLKKENKKVTKEIMAFNICIAIVCIPIFVPLWFPILCAISMFILYLLSNGTIEIIYTVPALSVLIAFVLSPSLTFIFNYIIVKLIRKIIKKLNKKDKDTINEITNEQEEIKPIEKTNKDEVSK